MPNFEEVSNQINSDDLFRHQWISVAAYFKAEKKEFQLGKEVDNWLEAEIEYIEFQIQTFFVCCEENGGMTILSLQKLASLLGIANSKNMCTEVKLIREIQKIAHHRPCFRTAYQQPCEDPESECLWRAECQKIIAVWSR